MASIIPEYNYDIFISYRQKDNKGDRWVSEFVDALKDELESTFKEDISVYFDENPHDRLQDTYNVDKSLEGKLKCLIFIPIISQTYCDPRSYAWQNEFLPFLKMAEDDQFGKEVKLRNGNVASRILPIRIHDLEEEDVKLFEKETGSVLRAMDFVFKTSSGVNRPLTQSDNPDKNLNKTFYRDQINKVANAIKEIFGGLKTEPIALVQEKTQMKEPSEKVSVEEKSVGQGKSLMKLSKRKLLSGIVIIAILIIAGIFVYPKIFKRDRLEYFRSQGKISVAVMPFQNRTSDATWDDWENGIQEIIITYLSSSEELSVRQTESINGLIDASNLTNYASITPSIASNISKKLDANVFIYGSINQAGNRVRLIAQLIDSKTREIFKPFQIEGPSSEEYIFNIIDSLSTEINNFLVISQLKDKERADLYIGASTNSPEAYRKYVLGRKAGRKKQWENARDYYQDAIKIDPSFISAKILYSWALASTGSWEESRRLTLSIYDKRNEVPKNIRWYLDLLHKYYTKSVQELKIYADQLHDYDSQDPLLVHEIGVLYYRLHQYDDGITEYLKVLEIYKNLGVKPYWAFTYSDLADCYIKTGQYSKARKYLKKGEKDFPEDMLLISQNATVFLLLGDTKKADEYIEKYISYSRDRSRNEITILRNLAGIYIDAKIFDKAEEYYHKAISLAPEDPVVLNSFARFLINNELNIEEGLEYNAKALEMSPNNTSYLDCRGVGLYKQGKHNEALEILEKAHELTNSAVTKIIYDFHIQEVKQAIASQQ